jgi:hypothetical protein
MKKSRKTARGVSVPYVPFNDDLPYEVAPIDPPADMLERYWQRSVIGDRELQAGLILRRAICRAQIGDRLQGLSKGAYMEIAIERAAHALGARIPAEDIGVLFLIAAEGRSIGSIPIFQGRNHRRGKLHLRRALSRLADALKL